MTEHEEPFGAAEPSPSPAERTQKVRQSELAGLPIAFGKYTLTRRLGVGGMAEAFLAQTAGPSGFQKTLVVKRMLPHLAEDERYVRMFQKEARVAALLSHTNIVQIFELGEVDGHFFIAMEHVDGSPLQRIGRTALHKGVAMPLELVCCAVADAALGLAFAHELRDPQTGEALGLVHRDISPDNLMMNKEGVTKVLDFGIAKLGAAGNELTRAGELKGKLAYMSPEQLRGVPLDGRHDLYALGVTFYGLVTAKKPFRARGDAELMDEILTVAPRPPRELNPYLPRALDELIMRLLDKDRERRPASGTVVYDVLVETLASRRSVVVPFVRELFADDGSGSGGAGAGGSGGSAGTVPRFMPPGFVSERARALWPGTANPAVVDDATANLASPVAPAEARADGTVRDVDDDVGFGADDDRDDDRDGDRDDDRVVPPADLAAPTATFDVGGGAADATGVVELAPLDSRTDDITGTTGPTGALAGVGAAPAVCLWHARASPPSRSPPAALPSPSPSPSSSSSSSRSHRGASEVALRR